MDWLKCNICFNTYNDSSLRPRSLSCGHTYCERCLNNVIQNETLTCPQCRKMHELNSVLDIPINFNLEGLLKSLNICSQDVTEESILSPLQETSDTDCKRESHGSLEFLSKAQEKCITQKELLKTSAGVCNEHPSKECLFRCSVHKCWVCEHCIEEHGDHPKHKCKILSFREEIEYRRQEHKQSLEDESKSCNISFSVIERHISCLRDERESHISLVNLLQDVLDIHKEEEDNIQSEIVSFQSIIEKGKNVHQRLLDTEGTVLDASTLDESNAARDLVKIKTVETRKWIDTFHIEVNEGKHKIENKSYSTEYREKCELLHKKIEKINNKSGINEQSANKIKSTDMELTRIEVVPTSLRNVTNMERKKEAKNAAKEDALSEIVKAIKCFMSHDPKKNKIEHTVQIFKVKIILRLLQLSFFNVKMNVLDGAANENTNVYYYNRCHGIMGEDEGLSVERMVKWVKEDLDDIWDFHHGTHQVLVKNIHGIISNLALDISPEQFDHLYGCFQTLWNSLSMKQRENLLELVQTFFKDGKYRLMANKVLSVLWYLAHSDDTPNKIMDQAIYAHVKLLDCMCSHLLKKKWLDCCVEELKRGNQVLTALKHFREIICTYSEESEKNTKENNSRSNVMKMLQTQHSVVVLVADNLTTYMQNISCTVKRNQNINPKEIFPDGHYNHIDQVQERLSFLQFVLQNGDLWLCSSAAKKIWSCLVENAVLAVDRESCFKWFSILIGDDDDQDLHPEINNDFLNKIMQVDPSLLTDNGMNCFGNFFKAVNQKKSKLVLNIHRYLMEDKDLIGLDYMWRIILYSSEDVAARASELLRETFTNLGPRLTINKGLIHDYFISKCMLHLETIYDNVLVLEKEMNSFNKISEETMRMCRVLTVLYNYIFECDREFVKSGYNIAHKFQDMLKKYSAIKLYYVKS